LASVCFFHVADYSYLINTTGQRYDVIVTADQASEEISSFWMRAIPQVACSATNTMYDNIMGIVYYGDDADTPTSSGYEFTDSCDDETDNLSPYVSKTVDDPWFRTKENVTVGGGSDGFAHWFFNSSAMNVKWADPTLEKVLNDVETFSTAENVISLDEENQWFYLAVETTIPVDHPLHLHGHDFFILAQETGTYDNSVSLNLENPPRRDVVMLPASGYVVIAFQTDNPGVWLMHCHIGWHTSMGLDLQFVERYSEIEATVTQATFSDNCDTWSDWQTKTSLVEEDSGV
jgi:FtsP/CotA-like multicopper oxidase with cupredoxin domain